MAIEYNSGWIRLYRVLLTKRAWKEAPPKTKVVMITLLLMANWKDATWEWNGQVYHLKPGQMVTSLKSIHKRCDKGLSDSSIRTAIKWLTMVGFLTNESTKGGRLITILNWEQYQAEEIKNGKRFNNALLKNPQTISKISTNDVQISTNDLAANEEVKRKEKPPPTPPKGEKRGLNLGDDFLRDSLKKPPPKTSPEIWKQFLTHKKEAGYRYTPTQDKAIRKSVAKAIQTTDPPDPNYYFREAIEQNYAAPRFPHNKPISKQDRMESKAAAVNYKLAHKYKPSDMPKKPKPGDPGYKTPEEVHKMITDFKNEMRKKELEN